MANKKTVKKNAGKGNEVIGTMYRHGDLLITAIDNIPNDVPKRDGVTLAWGEVTGHHHTLECNTDNATLFERNGNLYFSLKKDSAVVHQEHARIGLPAGNYSVVIQQEYQPKAAPKRVLD